MNKCTLLYITYWQCYLVTLSTVVTLQNEYLESKNVKNILQRYSRLRAMIKVGGPGISYPEYFVFQQPFYLFA